MLFPWIQRKSNLTNWQENVGHIHAFEVKAKHLSIYIYITKTVSCVWIFFKKQIGALRGPVTKRFFIVDC